MSNETTLLPCPFCGGEVELTTYRDEGYTIECNNHDWPKAEGFHPIADENIAGDIQLCSWGPGDEAKKALITAWNTRSTYGTLTAEQVEKAIHDCSTYASYDGCTYYASGIRLQAIADELNARAERTCKNEAKSWGEFECSECGFYADFGSDLHRVRVCPDCGKAVK